VKAPSTTRWLGLWGMAWGCAGPTVATAPTCEAPAQAFDAGLPEGDAALAEVIEALGDAPLTEPVSLVEVPPLDRALLAYALELPPEALEERVHPDDLGRVGEGLQRGLRAALAARDDAGVDAELVRHALHQHYRCERALPTTLDELAQQVGAWWEVTPVKVDMSVPKQAPRRLYDLPEQGLHVAVSEGDDGEEVEVVWSTRRDDGAIDLATYGPDGRLTDRAALRFGSDLETLPAPYACLLCHRDLQTLRFDVVHP